jgi:HKD family nuclease
MDTEVTMVSTWPDADLLQAVRGTLDGADEAILATAFVDTRGIQLLDAQLAALGPTCRLLVTSVFDRDRTAAALSLAHQRRVRTRVLNWSRGTYHPKLYLAKAGSSSRAVVGSANLTSGLFGNVEVATSLSGQTSQAVFSSLWSFAEELWNHERSQDWSPTGEESPDVIEPDLWRLLSKVVRSGDVVATLGLGAPNRIAEMTPAGIWVETARSAQRGGPELVEPRMVQLAWDWLIARGTLSNKTLLNDLRVHRSSFVCALLAQLPGVRVVSSRPIVLAIESAGAGRGGGWS